MVIGSGNVHGFTGKELDAETGFHYFCQRYYDSQIGRFMSLDKWTHLPDDERLFSYERYLSWNNYLLKYTPQMPSIPKRSLFRRQSNTVAYDTLTGEIVSLFSAASMPDLSDSVIYGNRTKSNVLSVFRYYQVSEKFQNQLNGHRYCWNNPLKYIDPDGNSLDPVTATMLTQLLMELALGLRVSVLLYTLHSNLEPGYGYEFNYGIGSLWLFMDDNGDYHWRWLWDEELFGPQGWD